MRSVLSIAMAEYIFPIELALFFSFRARVGLDVDGGTGSFAAHMAKLGVTIVTSAVDQDSTGNDARGVPFSETIAARGLIPLHVPKEVRDETSQDPRRDALIMRIIGEYNASSCVSSRPRSGKDEESRAMNIQLIFE